MRPLPTWRMDVRGAEVARLPGPVIIPMVRGTEAGQDRGADERPPRWRSLGCLATLCLALVGALLTVLAAALALVVPNAIRPDAPVPRGVDPTVRTAIAQVSSCPRISAFQVDGQHVRFECTWTVFGWPRTNASASCGGDGAGWVVGGWLSDQYTSLPCQPISED